MSGFTRRPAGDIPPGGPVGPVVYVVVEEWLIHDPGGGKTLTVEAVHLTREGAEGNLEPADKSGLRKRSVIAVEVQP